MLVYHFRALFALDLIVWSLFTFMDFWPGQALAMAACVGLLAFRFGLRLGEAADEPLA
jgi:hypothetical protein